MKKLILLLCLLAVVPASALTNNGDSVTRILAIGNSFSEDALDYHFHKLCEAAGKKLWWATFILAVAPSTATG